MHNASLWFFKSLVYLSGARRVDAHHSFFLKIHSPVEKIHSLVGQLNSISDYIPFSH